jgi:GT2 family glycosyltransferase
MVLSCKKGSPPFFASQPSGRNGCGGKKGEDMISVVVSVHNGEGSIRDCLGALLSQDYRGRKEIIVVDDGSTDRTAAEVRKFRKVKLVSQTHKGPAAARNLGIRHAAGEIILFTDHDCVPERGWIREMLKPFRNPNVMGVQGAYKTRQKELVARFVQMEIEDRYERMKKWQTVDFIGTYSAAYRSCVFQKFGGFDESFPLASGEDSELSFRLSKKGCKMVFNPKAIVYHKHPASLSEYLKVKFWRAYWRVLLYRKHRSKAVRESYTPQGLKLQIGLFYLSFSSLVLSVFSEGFILASLASYALLILSSLPFSARVFRKDRAAGAASVFILQLRSLVFGLGLFEGLVRGGRT